MENLWGSGWPEINPGEWRQKGPETPKAEAVTSEFLDAMDPLEAQVLTSQLKRDVMGWIVPRPNPHVEALSPYVTVFGDRALRGH